MLSLGQLIGARVKNSCPSRQLIEGLEMKMRLTLRQTFRSIRAMLKVYPLRLIPSYQAKS